MQVVRPYPPLVAVPTPFSLPSTLAYTSTQFVNRSFLAQVRSRQTRRHGSSCVAAAQSIGLTQADSHKLLTSLPSDPEDLATAAGVQRLVRCAPTALGRGLVAKIPLDRQTIVSAPLENALIITDEPLDSISIFGDRCQAQWQAAHGPLPPQLADFLGGDARWDVRMTAWLLWVAGELPDSPVWGRYVGTLPRLEEVTCLLNYGPQEAAELQLPELLEEARAQHAWAQTVHRKYFDPSSGELRQLRLASRLEDTLWAMSMVRTRTFSDDVGGEGLTLMVPYADLANHSFNHTATFGMSPDTTRFELQSLGPLGSGVEATISYGEGKPNSEVMRDYGFVVPGNPNDRVPPGPGSQPPPALNGASLMEAIGFSGDWRQGEVAPQPEVLAAAAGSREGQLTLARRRCVLLSLRLCDGLPVQPGNGGSGDGGGGGLFGSRNDASKSETSRGASSSNPSPQPLRHTAGAYAAERAAVTSLRESYEAVLDSFATSIDTDEAMLLAQCSPLTPPQQPREMQQQQEPHQWEQRRAQGAELQASSLVPTFSSHRLSSFDGEREDGSIMSPCSAQAQSASSASATVAPHMEDGRTGTDPWISGTSSPGRLLSPRLEAAVRCRLEAKRLVAECLALLRQYDGWLTDRETHRQRKNRG